MESEPNPQSQSSKSKIILLIGIIILLAIAGFFYYKTQPPTDENAPPQLEISSATLQGKLSDTDMYYAFTKEDVDKFKEPKDSEKRTLAPSSTIS
jgi:hypothetical protein